MIGMIVGPILTILAILALRSEDVRWSYAVPLGLIPGLVAFFFGIYGCLGGALLTAAYWKLKLS
jgi:hypothetical protein